MHASHSIEVEPETGFVRYTLGGFFEDESLASLQAERLAKLPQLKTKPNQHVSLIDVRACAIQSQEALMKLGEMLAQPEWRARRVAFVVGGALARMQVRRLVEHMEHADYFEDNASAEAWLRA